MSPILASTAFAGDGQQLDREIGWQAAFRALADAIEAMGQIEIEGHRPITRYRLRPRQA